MTLKARIARLEQNMKAAVPTNHWGPPRIVEVCGGDDEEKVEALYHEAIRAGWIPAHGPCVVVVHHPATGESDSTDDDE